MATPKLFSDEENNNSFDIEDNNAQTESKVQENEMSKNELDEKEPEMFDNSESEEDLEIPAFLRKQKT